MSTILELAERVGAAARDLLRFSERFEAWPVPVRSHGAGNEVLRVPDWTRVVSDDGLPVPERSEEFPVPERSRGAVTDVTELSEKDLMAALAAFGRVRAVTNLALSELTAEVSARSGIARGANSMAKREGHASATELAADVLDITPAEAKSLIRVGQGARPSSGGMGSLGTGAPRYPKVQEALAAGRLKFLAADLITSCLDGIGPIASAEQRANLEDQLVAAAARVGLTDLKRMCLEARAILDPGSLERREAEQRKNRSLTMFIRDDGMLQIKLLLPPFEGALVRNSLHAVVRQLAKHAPEHATRSFGPRGGTPQPYPSGSLVSPIVERSERSDRNAPEIPSDSDPSGAFGHTATHRDGPAPSILTAPAGARFDSEGRPLDADATVFTQLLADAMVTLVRHAAGCSNRGEDARTIPTTQLVVRIQAQDLIDGVNAANIDIDDLASRNERLFNGGTTRAGQAGTSFGEIDGHPEPISISQIRRIAAAAEVIPAVMGGPSEILDWGRAERLFTRPQRLAIFERDGGCAFPGCGCSPSMGAVHHLNWWERDHGDTDMDNAVALCLSHHHRIHDQGWEVSIHPSREDPGGPPIPHFIAPRTAHGAIHFPGAYVLDDGRIEIPGRNHAEHFQLTG